MQIITGKYRARKLVSVVGNTTRPTLARVKESVFNLINDMVDDKVVLDLFAGSGAFGAECISRGAKKVYFVDKEANAISAIKTNTRNMIEDFEILRLDFKNALLNFKKNNVKFDLVYLDPPYKSNFAMNSLTLLDEYNLLNNDSVIVVEHERENDLQNLPECYIINSSRKYGIAYVDILRYKV